MDTLTCKGLANTMFHPISPEGQVDVIWSGVCPPLVDIVPPVRSCDVRIRVSVLMELLRKGGLVLTVCVSASGLNPLALVVNGGDLLIPR